MSNVTFVNCELCGKRLIMKRDNGLWYFSFGKSVDGVSATPVELYIIGAIKIKCIRRTCNHWNELTPFPEPVGPISR